MYTSKIMLPIFNFFNIILVDGGEIESKAEIDEGSVCVNK